jgi:2-polyprenyl-6-hydroxyphenyl methylase/3-demethylubiquinone-9 3-methyltransferase
MNADAEIQAGDRFAFGANWAHFLTTLDEMRIAEAENSLRDMLGVIDLHGRSFLDIGCGSGLFSLAARRLGAQVHSFDFDSKSVACAQELKRRFFPEDDAWYVGQGSVLDREYIGRLGQFDVVYSWGVLHHTGSMWLAIENAISRVATPRGTLFIAIYNDQGWKSHVWWFVKLIYNRLPHLLKKPFFIAVSVLVHALVIVKYSIKLKPMIAIAPLLSDRRERGMSARHDAIDWIGGFPYEFAKFDILANYLEARGFELTKYRRHDSQGCNEFVARRASDAAACAE